MRRLLLVTSLVVVLLWEAGAVPAPKVPIKMQVKHWPSEQDPEKAWGARVVEPPEKDDQLVVLFPVQKPKLLTTEEKPRGTKAWMESRARP
uniref:Isoform 2 of Proline-rich acidic protein 1 n=1 Tax=Homo sapiens TaxID=9606 RepID=Q96NZ9-2|nr:proline-rich acidic protein variant [Homo sapiens]